MRRILRLQKPVSLAFLLISIFSATNISLSDKNKISAASGTDSTFLTEIRTDTLDAIVQSLLEASSRDFYIHQPPLPVAFRNVRLKFLVKAGGIKVYMLCGQFLAQDDPIGEKWMDFATIKTSDYEQWIGSNAVAYCQDAEGIQYGVLDLSSALKSRVDSLQ